MRLMTKVALIQEKTIDLFFSDFFEVNPQIIETYGAFNVSLVSDLPLFIDPFLLFNSKKPKYRNLHDEMIQYLSFLKEKSLTGGVSTGLLKRWYQFHEVKQTWLGFSVTGNRGSGLGRKFASALNQNLNQIFKDFGKEKVTKTSHLEKLCLIKEGVGRDNISDFTTNLIKEFLLNYTQDFAQKHLQKKCRKNVAVEKVRFNYETESWESATFDLPWYANDFVILTPSEILTKDDTWINKSDLVESFTSIPESIPNDELRAQVNNYFLKMLPKPQMVKKSKKQKPVEKEPTAKEIKEAALKTIERFPQLIDYFIKYKEDHEQSATSLSADKIAFSKYLFIQKFKELIQSLANNTSFYDVKGDTYDEAYQRCLYLKDNIENKGGHHIFYDKKGKLLNLHEDSVHILYRLCWYGTLSAVDREVDNGRGGVDFSISSGRFDKSLVEFKLAKNSQLKRNLENQVPIYEKAGDAQKSIKVIFYFSEKELERVTKILNDLKMSGDKNIILIDARPDNKPSASKA